MSKEVVLYYFYQSILPQFFFFDNSFIKLYFFSSCKYKYHKYNIKSNIYTFFIKIINILYKYVKIHKNILLTKSVYSIERLFPINLFRISFNILPPSNGKIGNTLKHNIAKFVYIIKSLNFKKKTNYSYNKIGKWANTKKKYSTPKIYFFIRI